MSLFRLKYQVSREVVIASDAKTVFDHIIKFDKKAKWSPWYILDRECAITKTGKEGTKGYIESWNSGILGEGIEEIVEIKADKLLKTKLKFIKPYPSEALSEFIIDEKDGRVKLTWNLSSSLPLFMFFKKDSIIKMLLEDFRRGFVMLKDYIELKELETSSTVDGADTKDTFYYIGIHGHANSSSLHDLTSLNFNGLLEYCHEKSVTCSTMMTIFDKVDLENNDFDFTCCLLVDEPEYDRLLADFSHEEIFMGRYDSTSTLKIIHKGSYHYLPNSWVLGYMYAKSEKLLLRKNFPAIEIYQNRLEGVEEKDLVSEVHIPIIE